MCTFAILTSITGTNSLISAGGRPAWGCWVSGKERDEERGQKGMNSAPRRGFSDTGHNHFEVERNISNLLFIKMFMICLFSSVRTCVRSSAIFKTLLQ